MRRESASKVAILAFGSLLYPAAGQPKQRMPVLPICAGPNLSMKAVAPDRCRIMELIVTLEEAASWAALAVPSWESHRPAMA